MSKFGLAAALTLSSVAAAQGTASSQTRIPVKPKDATGEVALPRVDTVTNTVYRTDTVRVYSTDTLRVPGAVTTNTVRVYDTTRIETLPGWLKRPGGMYAGLGFGPTFQGMALVPAQEAGYAFTGQLGFDPMNSPLGLRLDAVWARPDQQQLYTSGARPEIVNLNGDLKLRLPPLTKAFPLSFYAVGGASYIRYKDLKVQLSGAAQPGTLPGNVLPGDGRWHDQWGWNTGLGMAIGYGKTELFIEGRMVNFNVQNTSDARQYPIAIGFNWY